MSLRPLSKELQEAIEKSQPGTLQRFDEDLKYLREWLRLQHHLSVRDNDQWLAVFLRSCKHSLERTKEKIDNYYTMKSLIPEFFSHRDPYLPELQKLLKQGTLIPLPNALGPGGPKILLCRCKYIESPLELVKLFYMLMDVWMLEDDNVTVSGVIFWTDLDGISIETIEQCTPVLLKKAFVSLQEGYPLQVKQLQYTNGIAAFEVIFNLIKSLLKNKLKERIFYHSAANTKKNLLQHIPEKYFPREYGGENGSISELTELWKTKIEGYKDWYVEDAKYGCDESQRTSASELFGVDGLFRKLTVD